MTQFFVKPCLLLLSILAWSSISPAQLKTLTDHNTGAQGSTTNLSDSNGTSSPVYVDVEMREDSQDGICYAWKVDSNGDRVGDVITIDINNDHTFILAQGEKVVGADWDSGANGGENDKDVRINVDTHS